MTEKRKEIRHRVKERTFVIDWSTPQRLGEIIDISRSGLAFRCMEGQNGFQAKTELGIFSSAHKFFLQRILFETLSDVRIEGHPSSSIIMRRYSGRFFSLTREQKKEIERFIDKHIQGLVQPNAG